MTLPVKIKEKIKFYNANPKLKRAGQEISLTKAELEEYVKCSEDPIYFIESYVKIVTIDDGLIPIKLWKFQKDAIRACHNYNRFVYKAARQLGKTTTIATGYLLWYALFNPDKTIGILAQKEKTAIEILSRIKTAYLNLPLWIQQGVEEWNKQSIELENGSKILSESTSSGAIRGFTISLLYLDEFAFVPNNIAHDFLTSVYPTISSGKTSKIIISSTPNGMNHFYKMVTDAKFKRNGFKLLEHDWRARPDRDKKWEKDQRSVLGEEKFLQEMEGEFLGSAGTLISSVALKAMTFVDAMRQMFEEKLQIYEEAQEDHSYILSADSSHGKELDYSSFVVIDITVTPYRIVAKYKSNTISGMLYPNIIAQVGKYYNNAYALVENNDIGAQVLHILVHDLEYDNLFYTEDVKTNTILSTTPRSTAGIKTTSKVRRQGCNALKSIIENGQLQITDFDIISELSTFVMRKNKRYEADDGANDDLVMCLVIFAYLTQQQFFKDLTNLDIRQRLYNQKMKEIEEELPSPVMPSMNELDAGKYVKEGDTVWEIVGDTNNPYYNIWGEKE